MTFILCTVQEREAIDDVSALGRFILYNSECVQVKTCVYLYIKCLYIRISLSYVRAFRSVLWKASNGWKDDASLGSNGKFVHIETRKSPSYCETHVECMLYCCVSVCQEAQSHFSALIYIPLMCTLATKDSWESHYFRSLNATSFTNFCYVYVCHRAPLTTFAWKGWLYLEAFFCYLFLVLYLCTL